MSGIATEEAGKEIRICKRCPYIIAAQKEYHKLCMMVNRKLGGIEGVTCGVIGRYDEKHHREYFKRIGLDIETGLPIGVGLDSILEELEKKLSDDFVYYDNVSVSGFSPTHMAVRNYAHDLLKWLKQKMLISDEEHQRRTDGE